jgi:hypothetical protein
MHLTHVFIPFQDTMVLCLKNSAKKIHMTLTIGVGNLLHLLLISHVMRGW